MDEKAPAVLWMNRALRHRLEDLCPPWYRRVLCWLGIHWWHRGRCVRPTVIRYVTDQDDPFDWGPD